MLGNWVWATFTAPQSQWLNFTTRARPDPRGPARTCTDPHGLCLRPARTQRRFSETRAAKNFVRVRASSVASGRARVVEFSMSPTQCADFVWSGPVQSGPVGPVLWNLAINKHGLCTTFPVSRSSFANTVPKWWNCSMSNLFWTLRLIVRFCFARQPTKTIVISRVGFVCLRNQLAACNCTVARCDFIAR